MLSKLILYEFAVLGGLRDRFILDAWVVGRIRWSPYNDWKQHDLSWSDYIVCSFTSCYSARLGGHFISFEFLLT